VVTGAFGYTGRYIAGELLTRGLRVRTLTNATDRFDPFGGAVEVHPIRFDRPDELRRSLVGAVVLHNTYWVRYDHRSGGEAFGYEEAVANTRILLRAASGAGVPRLVHVSVANAGEDSDWGYFRGKAILEREVHESGLSHAIVRPTILFGGHPNVFVNNIAWMLRRLPVFGLFGRGRERVTPIHVRDVARLCVEASLRAGDEAFDASGPETMSYREMVRQIARGLGLRRLILPMPPRLVLAIGWAMGKALRDVVITGHEVSGLRDGLMYVAGPGNGILRFGDSIREERETLGRVYRNDLAVRIGG
jgi:NADH dehydrogenase